MSLIEAVAYIMRKPEMHHLNIRRQQDVYNPFYFQAQVRLIQLNYA